MSDGPRPPSLAGCLRLGPAAVAGILRSPTVFLLVAVTVFAIAFAPVLPIYQDFAAHLDHQPLASGRFGRLLYDEVNRVDPGTRLLLGGSLLSAMFLWTFFAGGVIACIGLVTGVPRGVAEFLAESGRYFLRSLRCWVVFMVLVGLWTWISLGLVKPPLERQLVDGSDGRTIFWFEIGVNVVWFIGFAKLWILRRLALARLVLGGRRSALVGHVLAMRLLARRPLRCLAAYLSLFLLWGSVLAVSAVALDRFLDGGRLGLALLAGAVAFLAYQGCLMASFVVARRLWVLDGGRWQESLAPPVVLPPALPESDRPA